MNRYKHYNYGETAPQREQAYVYPSLDDSDDKIWEFVEERRNEFREAWYDYVKEFD